MSSQIVIIGGGPGGTQAAIYAARYGADVTLIEREIVGGAAHLLDCVPSKAMIATGGALAFQNRNRGMGLREVVPEIDLEAMRNRIASIEKRLELSVTNQLDTQGVRVIKGTGKLVGPYEVEVTPNEGRVEVLPADKIVLATGSRPRVPDWAPIDAVRVLTTRDAYPPPVLPEHLVVIGSGVTGVEFVHMFSSFGCKVTLIVSRQQVLPQKDPEAAAMLEEEFLRNGVSLLKGARAEKVSRDGDVVTVSCDDGRVVVASHVLLAVGSTANSDSLGLESAGLKVNEWGYLDVDHNCKSAVGHIYACGDLSGRLPLSSVAAMQGRKIAEHAMGLHETREHSHIDYDKAASAIFTVPEIAEVGLAEADAYASGRKIRVTKVPFAMNPKALINDDPRGFVKIVSDPYTGIVLGGSIVGRHAAELISVIALAVNSGLKVSNIHECLFVHPALVESLSEAAE